MYGDCTLTCGYDTPLVDTGDRHRDSRTVAVCGAEFDASRYQGNRLFQIHPEPVAINDIARLDWIVLTSLDHQTRHAETPYQTVC